MNKFQKVGVAIAVFSGMAFAALWTPTAPYGQVQFPWIVDCTSQPNFDETDSNSPCYKDYGGWWFGYLAGWEGDGTEAGGPKEVGPKVCVGAPGMPADGGNKSATNKVEARINNEWVSFIGPDYTECEGPAVTDKTNGTPLISSDGLDLKLTVGKGYIKDPDYEPSIAGVAVSLTMKPKEPRDVKAKNGFCLTYISDHQNTYSNNTGAEMQLELGWDEGIKSNMRKGYDSWYSIIPESNNVKKTQDFTWTGTQVQNPCVSPPTMNESGMFQQDNYTCWTANQGKPQGAPFPIDSATKELVQVKIRLKGYEAQVVNFKLMEFGFAGECGGSGTPIVASGSRPVNLVSFEMSGKVLSMNSSAGKPLAVQIINLKGAVVQSKTMSQGDKMSLQNLPAGIYMVRVPALGYTAKQVVK